MSSLETSGDTAMALVQLNLDALQATISALKVAIRDMPDAAAGLRRRLDYVGLSAPGLAAWTPGGSAEAELRDILADLQHRFDVGVRLLDLCSTGMDAMSAPGPHVVWLDESLLDDQDAQTVADLIGQYVAGSLDGPRELPQELLDLLAADGDDPEFCQHLAALVDPAQAASVVLLLDAQRYPDGPASGPGVGTAVFEARFDELVTRLGAALGAGTQQLAVSAQQQVCDMWAQALAGAPSTGAALSLIISRGVWPDVFLTGMADTISGLEAGAFSVGDAPVDFWHGQNAFGIADPGTRLPDGTPLRIQDPMYGVWLAARANPGWMAGRYLGGGTVSLLYDQDEDHLGLQGRVPAGVWDLFDTRGMDTASLVALAQAAGSADLSASLTGDDGSLFQDVQVCLGHLRLEQREYDAEGPWQKYHHQILGAIATIAGIGAIVASGGTATPLVAAGLAAVSTVAVGVDLFYNITEDDVAGAVLDGVCLVPVAVGMIGAAARYVRLMRLTREQVEALKAGEEVVVYGARLRLAGTEIVDVQTLGAKYYQSLRLTLPTLGGTDQAGGKFTLLHRNLKGLAYQSRVVDSPIIGQNGILEYRQPYTPVGPKKKPYVDFDGHGWKNGHQIFVETKDGYRYSLVDSGSSALKKAQLERFAKQARAQDLAAHEADPGAIVVWACSDPDVVPVIQAFFNDQGIAVAVLYVP